MAKEKLAEAIEALESAIVDLANSARTSNSSSYAGGYAAAARDLAEARAWLKAPAQPHGGATKVEVSG
jgi:hypothetical protein